LLVLDIKMWQAKLSRKDSLRGIYQRGGDGHRAEAIPLDRVGTQTPATVSSAPARRDLTIPCGSSTNFFAAPLSKSWYPRGASYNGNTSTFTAFAILTLSCLMMAIPGRWTIKAAIDEAVPASVFTAALYERFSSRGEADFANKVLSAMRYQFGGHLEKSGAQSKVA
jgi:hypothetical protein